MKELKQTLQQHIGKSSLQLWHILTLLSLLWIIPLFLPGTLLERFGFVYLGLWVVGYFAVNRLIKRIMRVSTTDVILIERFFILLSFLVPGILGVVYGMRHGFDLFVTILSVATWIITLLLIIGIILHIKNVDKYYHGVKKDELFK